MYTDSRVIEVESCIDVDFGMIELNVGKDRVVLATSLNVGFLN